MPKLFQIDACSNWGSTGKIVEQIGLLAEAQGWEVLTAFGRYSNPSKLRRIKVGNKFFTYEHYFEHRFLDREGLASRIPTRRLIRQIEEFSPDVVQLHDIHDHWLNYPILFDYLNKKQIPVVWTQHDCWSFTGHCCHFVEVPCSKWKTGCDDCPLKQGFCDRSKDNYLLKKRLFSGNENLTLVSVSDWIEGFIKESFLGPNRSLVIHNGIDLDVFKPLTNHSDDGKFRVIAVSGVWSKSKGLEDIYQLRNLLPAEYEITIVGLNEEQIQSLPSGIIGIKRTQSVQQLVELYSRSDVFINPTYADTFPTVNLEALACGTPVITYRTGGSPEAVNEKTGIVISQGDVNSLCSSIMDFKLNDFKNLHSADCHARAEGMFDSRECFNAYISLYSKLLGG